MKIYLSGGVHGRVDGGRDVFDAAADRLRHKGHEPVIPLDIPVWQHDGDCPPAYSNPDHSAACYMRSDLLVLLQCDAVLMVGEWQSSVGAVREMSVACWVGIPVYTRQTEVNYAVENATTESKPRILASERTQQVITDLKEMKFPERQGYEVPSGDPIVLFMGTTKEFAERIQQAGEDFIQRKGIDGDEARVMLDFMIKFVTGEVVQ